MKVGARPAKSGVNTTPPIWAALRGLVTRAALNGAQTEHSPALSLVVYEGPDYLNDLIVGIHHRVLECNDGRFLGALVLLKCLLLPDDSDDSLDGLVFTGLVCHVNHGSRFRSACGSSMLDDSAQAPFEVVAGLPVDQQANSLCKRSLIVRQRHTVSTLRPKRRVYSRKGFSIEENKCSLLRK